MVATGTLYGISVGTGDPELITVKGLKLLQACPVVAFPAGKSDRMGMAEKIVTPWLKPHQQQLPLHFPYTQNLQQLTAAWELAAAKVALNLQQGEDVAFACEGDISFYSTFTYLAATLRQRHPQLAIQMIPGVSIPMAAAAVLGMPLTKQEQRLAIIPALYRVSELVKVLEWAEVIILMKFSSVYPEIWQILAEYNLLEKSVVVEKATLPEEMVYRNLSDRPNLQLSYFSVMIVENDSFVKRL